jgi:gamma-glutamyltranspeptidase/glutathione hydrolase
VSASSGAPTTVALAAPHSLAVDAAIAAVAAGGNALDAALAAAAMLTVVYPHQCSLGGDLLAVIVDGSGSASSVISAGAAPAAIDVAMLGALPRMPRQGPHAVTVPGVVAGWKALAGLGAALPLAWALERARDAAGHGTVVSDGMARALRERRNAVVADEGLRSVFASSGEPAVSGDRVDQPALAATLDLLAEDVDSFYTGAVADRLVEALQSRGGCHSAGDFAHHVAVVEPALERDVGGVTWWSVPPPGPGAILLRVLPVALGGGCTADLLDASLAASEARDHLLGDPRTAPVDVDALMQGTRRGTGTGSMSADDSGDTAAVVATDSEGRTVTLIQSVYQSFGSGILDPMTGIVLHNRGSAFSTDPRSPARVAPGSRPPHTLCPTIAATSAGVVALGCQGGRAQPWILAQLARDAIDRDTRPKQLLARSRWVIGAEELGQADLSLVAEPGLGETVAAATARGVPVVRHSRRVDEAGHVQLVRRFDEDHGVRFDGASDPRADGRFVVTSH